MKRDKTWIQAATGTVLLDKLLWCAGSLMVAHGETYAEIHAIQEEVRKELLSRLAKHGQD